MFGRLQNPEAKPHRLGACLFGGCVGLMVLMALGISFALGSFFGQTRSILSTNVSEEIVKEGSGGTIGVIPIHGLLSEGGGFEEGVVTARQVQAMIDRAVADAAVKAVILEVDSPGGGVVTSATIEQALERLDQAKPVISALTGEVAASGGLYVALAGRKIVAHPDTLTGSIGVIAEFFDLSKLLADYGVSVNTIKSGQFKDLGSYSRPMTAEERQLLQDLINQAYNRFVETVARRRNLPLATVSRFADGRIISGSQAKDLALVDELGDLNDAIDLAEQLAGVSNAQVIRYLPPTSLADIFRFLAIRLDRLDARSVLEWSRTNHQPQLLYLTNP